MAVLDATHPTIVDVTKATDPDGSIAVVAEILNETQEMLDDFMVIEGNLPTGHRTTIRTGIPAPTWRMMYGYVQPTKSTRAQITDTIGMLEAYAEVDKALADLNGNTNEFRLSEDRAHLEGMAQEAANALFTADESVDPEKITGFVPRFNDLSAENGQNIINAGGTGSDNASIWLIGWGQNTVHGIYPKGSNAGLTMEDKGQVTLSDSSGGMLEGYRTHYQWKFGLTVRDWRYVVRIANIDRSNLTADASSGANLPQLMFEAETLVPNMAGAKFSYYMDRSTMMFVNQQSALLTKSSTLQWADVGGRKTMMSPTGLPMRRCDALSADEATVT